MAISSTAEAVRLDIGGGLNPLPGFVVVDRSEGSEAYPLAFDDASVDEIHASHILEHFSHTMTGKVLQDWWRVLKPGGRLRVAVPDFEWIAREYLKGSAVNIQGFTMGGHLDADDHHAAIFDAETLQEAMILSGFIGIRKWKPDYEATTCAKYPCSLNLEAFKPDAPLSVVRGKVAAVLSAPRFAPTSHARCGLHSLEREGVPYEIISGAFWDQCMQRGLEAAMRRAEPYVLTLDYDTIFTASHVRMAVALMDAHPEVDALAALQCGRGRRSPLFTWAGKDGKVSGEFPRALLSMSCFPVRTAHFGFTLLRAERLRAMPLPMLLSVPEPNGQWGEGRTDADIYFWRQWRKQGFTVHVTPRVRVGHIEEMIAWPDDDMAPAFQYVKEWDEANMPPGTGDGEPFAEFEDA